MKQQSKPNLRVRQPCFADNRWYSADAAKLEAEIENYLSSPSPEFTHDKLMGLIAPHAGYFFSGHVAGTSFANLTPDAYKTVILLGPDHRGAAPGNTSTLNVDVWRTPLGDIPVAWDILETLESEIDLKCLPQDDEHSLEIELPFLQITLKHFNLVPLMMGSQSHQTCQQLVAALVKAVQHQDGVIFIASSDLSHYFDDDTARQLDQTTLQFILNLDADGLLQHIEAGRYRGEPLACGAGPMATVIYATQALGAKQSHLLKYATSADVYPDKERVVGYAAIAISQ